MIIPNTCFSILEILIMQVSLVEKSQLKIIIFQNHKH